MKVNVPIHKVGLDDYCKAWHNFSILVIGKGVTFSCVTADDAISAFRIYDKYYPNADVQVYDLKSDTCIMQRLAI